MRPRASLRRRGAGDVSHPDAQRGVRRPCARLGSHPRKERERGYNQALLLARALALVAGGTTTVHELLRRTEDTATQTAFDRRTRMANLKNAFALGRGAALNPEQHYILVDDVFTTGSTLNSCARTLRRAGALKLDVITLGHG